MCVNNKSTHVRKRAHVRACVCVFVVACHGLVIVYVMMTFIVLQPSFPSREVYINNPPYHCCNYACKKYPPSHTPPSSPRVSMCLPSISLVSPSITMLHPTSAAASHTTHPSHLNHTSITILPPPSAAASHAMQPQIRMPGHLQIYPVHYPQ